MEQNSLKGVITSILDKIIESSGEQGLNPVPLDTVKQIVDSHNKDQILDNVNFREVKTIYWDIVDNSKEEDFIKLHFAETYLNKGISLINDNGSVNSKSLNEITDVRMPSLTAEALEYRYNNDKKPFID